MDQLVFRFSSISVSDHQHHNHQRSKKRHPKVHSLNHRQDPWNKLDDVLVESVLMQLPTVYICRCRFVCKRWRRVILDSVTVKFTYTQSFCRTPWFFVKLRSAQSRSSSFMVYDTEVQNWRRQPIPIDDHTAILKSRLTPVAASGELMCFSYFTDNNHSLIVMNPLTGSSRCILVLDTSGGIQIGGITLHKTVTPTSSPTPSYKVYALFRNLANLVLKVFSSCNKEDGWIELPLRPEITDGSMDAIISPINWDCIKVQNVIGVTTPGNAGNGNILLKYFERFSNRLICIDTKKGTYLMSDKLTSSLKLDMVKCNGRILVVILHQNVNGSRIQLEIFELDMIVLKPDPIISREFKFQNKTENITCNDHGDCVMICLKKRYGSVHKVVMWNYKEKKWYFFPKCTDRNGREVFFTSAYSFMPDIQAKV